MTIVIIESPFASDTEVGEETNRRYAIAACIDAFKRGEIPFASHLLYPQMLDDLKPEERERGILAGYAFWPIADYIAFYTDRGWSPGMLRAKERAINEGYLWGERKLKNKGL
jgi:hypothetical protein